MIPLLYFACRLQNVDLWWTLFLLSNQMAWNSSGLTIILLFLNQSKTVSDPGCKMSINFKIVSAKADNVLSLAKLWSETSDTKRNKSFTDKLKNTGPNIEPRGTPDIIFDSYCTYCLCERVVFGYLSTSIHNAVLYC